ncbi:Bacteriophage abortive infection AbiH [Lutibacter oricola]|uniref:Bacteriophage abortive infection AbiH n=1 Tax=Lutibacter oricola TaxID=762486 RepID=A0A1H3HBT8_9FLAO|nr:AbiH family protein [Lutibacter oricola]SDY12695.1 Bacteriophage abortive infection AbiH [Lutibacter oricola]
MIRKRKSNNAIIIIGNGFDLAHELKTSYNDFSNYFIENRIIKELQEILTTRNNKHTLFKQEFLNKFVRNQVYRLESYTDFIPYYLLRNEQSKLLEYFKENTDIIRYVISNKFLGKLYANNYLNWFDIENAYFKELIELKNKIADKKSLFEKDSLIELNNDFQLIKNELSDYLKTIKPIENPEIKKFLNNLLSQNQNKKFYIINFNYTNTIEKYLVKFDNSSNLSLNYIHGNLSNDNIIFGYGNDQNSDYQEIKNIEIDEFLKFFKTFEYLKNNNYSEIYQKSIDNFTDYEVYILGHSLGLSDKTLLEEILDTDKCKKIHLYKRTDLKDKKNELEEMFNKLLFAASRVIGNEKDLRKKINNYGNSSFFP